MRMELTRMVSSRLAVPESVIEQRIAANGRSTPTVSAGQPRANGHGQDRTGGARTGSGARRPGALLHGREDTERAFLALCIAAPQDGERALASLDLDEYFSSDLLRRAARHLRAGNLSAPMASASQDAAALEDDPELKALLAELVVEGGREAAHPAMLEAQRLQLELARVDRQIQRARGEQSGAVSELAGRRAQVKREFDRAYGRVLEETGDREG
jgi:DNA primase